MDIIDYTLIFSMPEHIKSKTKMISRPIKGVYKAPLNNKVMAKQNPYNSMGSRYNAFKMIH